METLMVSGPLNLFLLSSMLTFSGSSAARADTVKSNTSKSPSAKARKNRFLFISFRSKTLLPPSADGKPAGSISGMDTRLLSYCNKKGRLCQAD